MFPWQILAEYAKTVVPEGVNVYSTADDKIVAPAVVIRPDSPWREPHSFCIDRQRYVVVCVVPAAEPEDGTGVIYRTQSALIAALPDGFAFVSAGGIITDETTDTPLLASALRLTFDNSEEEPSE